MSLILSLDTTAAHCAVALLEGETLLASQSEPMTKGQAERLFPMMNEVLKNTKIDLKDLNAIAVATGPGNFTGVRICVSAARGLMLSLGIPAIGVSNLEALAYGHQEVVLALLDARADHLYAQIFNSPTMSQNPFHIAKSDLSADLPPIDRCVGFCAEEIAAEIGVPNFSTQMPSPETYGLIAQSRDWSNAPRPAPLYLRSPDAALPSEPAPHIIS